MKPRFHRLFNTDPNPAGGGDPAAAPAAAPAPPATPDPAAAPAPAPATPDPAAPPAPDPANKSALAGAGGDEWSAARVPEKFQVKNDKGELDVNATFRKVEEHRANLEKRLGAGDNIRPKTADEYKLPDTETFKAIGIDDTAAKAFKSEAHEWGLSQAQYEKVMEKYATLAPQLVTAGQELTAEKTIETLKGVWKDDHDTQMAGAYDVAQKLAGKAGVSLAEMDAAIGNNPVAIRMLASLHAEMKEDKTPAGANGDLGGNGGTTIETLLAHPAYSNASHPEHKTISEKVRKYYEKITPKDD